MTRRTRSATTAPPKSVGDLIDREVANYWLNRLMDLDVRIKDGLHARLALFDLADDGRRGRHALLQQTAEEFARSYSKEALAKTLVYELCASIGFDPDDARAKESFQCEHRRLHGELSQWDGIVQLRRQGERLARWQAAKPKGRRAGSGQRAASAEFRLTERQERALLEWIERHSPCSWSAFQVVERRLPGVPDLGRAIVHLAAQGLCGFEDPDLVWSTSAGAERLRQLQQQSGR